MLIKLTTSSKQGLLLFNRSRRSHIVASFNASALNYLSLRSEATLAGDAVLPKSSKVIETMEKTSEPIEQSSDTVAKRGRGRPRGSRARGRAV